MAEAAELAGLLGAGLAGAAYVPQISHLIRAHCSAGICPPAFSTWLAAALLVTIHAVASRAAVFIVLGAIQLVATTLVLVNTTKYRHSYCAGHSPSSLEPRPRSPHAQGPRAQDSANQRVRRVARAERSLEAGTLIDDRHEIDRLVGHGGMAEVFRARDSTTGQTVAIKILRAADPNSVRRFRTEHDVLSRLDHPAVIRLCGNGSHHGVPYLALELIDGPTLADLLTDGALDIDHTISIGQQPAEALTHAHSRDITHRDLKPANVMLDADPGRTSTSPTSGSPASATPPE